MPGGSDIAGGLVPSYVSGGRSGRGHGDTVFHGDLVGVGSDGDLAAAAPAATAGTQRRRPSGTLPAAQRLSRRWAARSGCSRRLAGQWIAKGTATHPKRGIVTSCGWSSTCLRPSSSATSCRAPIARRSTTQWKTEGPRPRPALPALQRCARSAWPAGAAAETRPLRVAAALPTRWGPLRHRRHRPGREE